jgi:hypothetical protein
MYNPNQPGLPQPVQYAPARPVSEYAAAFDAVKTKICWIEFACRNLTAQFAAFWPYPDPNRLYQLRTEFSTNVRYIVDALGLLGRDLNALKPHLLPDSPPGEDSQLKNELRAPLRELRQRLASAVTPIEPERDRFLENFQMRAMTRFLPFNTPEDTFLIILDEGPEAFQAAMLRWAPGREAEIIQAYRSISSMHIDCYQMELALRALNDALVPVDAAIVAMSALHEHDIIGDDGLNYTQRWWRNCAIGSVTFAVSLGIIIGIALA